MIFGRKKQVSKIKTPVYVSKLTGKKSVYVDKTASQSQGVNIGYVRRCINVVLSDINVICSIWKPRVVYKDATKYNSEDLYE